MTTKTIVLRVTLAKRAWGLQGQMCPSENLAMLDQCVRGSWCERKILGAFHSLRMMCPLLFKTRIYFISTLRGHKLNAKGPLI